MIFLTDELDFKLHPSCVLYFYASWMPYHKKMIIMLDKMEEKYKQLPFYAIDTDHFKSLCIRFDVESIPQIILYKDDKRYKTLKGELLTSAVKAAFNDIYEFRSK